jgi:NAD(P)H-dependent FMN reductase
MKIIVLGGSPKGETSVTMQYVQFIRNKFPEHEFEVLQAAQPIRKLEQNEDAFKEIIDEVRSADGIIWAFPLYVFLVCSQYKRFIELIWERKAEGAFKGKYTAALSTSIHFYDNTAHNYMRAICDDLEMKYTGCHSAAMRDLMSERGR